MDPARWKQLNEIFDAALERAPEDRSAYLDRVCAGDEEMRGEVASLLNQHDRAGSFMEAAPLAPSESAESLDLEAGHRVGPYVIVRELGRGGMGVVFLANDTRLGRPVALKFLPSRDAGDSARRQRLKREAKAAAALSHPGIATVYALEEIDGQLLIASEYIPGPTLRAELERGPLPIQNALRIAVELARALAAAHERGVVHRDLKPENIILSPQRGTKILDFGLARFEAGHTESTSRLTRTGVLLGTPAYMAPEQLQGRDADFRTDIFSFGLILHEMTTGSHPFGWSGPRSTPTRTETGTAGNGPTNGGGAIPLPGLEAIVRRCLQTDPAERYSATNDLVDALEQIRISGMSNAGDATAAARDSGVAFLSSRWWWELHQTAIAVLYGGMVYPAWRVFRAVGGTAALLLLLVIVAIATISIVLRVHLWFLSRYDPPALVEQRGRLSRPLVALDATMSLMWFAAAALMLPRSPEVTSLLVALAVGNAVAFLVIEPATTAAAFRTSNPGASGG